MSDERRDGSAQEPAAPEGSEPVQPTVRDAITEAARRSGLGAVATDQAVDGKALLSTMGGARGILEAVLPGTIFVLVFSVLTAIDLGDRPTLWWALGSSVGIAVVFTIARIVGRTPVTQAVGGLLGVVASAALALFTGRGEDNFVLGLLLNLGYAIAMVVSFFVRWPLIGVAVGFLMGDGTAWREDRRKFRVLSVLTLCWAALFTLRLVVQAPLYFSGNVEWLAATKLVMGLPLYAPLLVLTWITVRGLYRGRDRATDGTAAPTR